MAIRGMVLFDKEGNWIKEIDHFKVIGQTTYYNSENHDLFVLGGPGEVEIDTWTPDEIVNGRGCIWKVTVPGYGVVYMETGRIVLDCSVDGCDLVFDSGHNQYFDDDVAALCSILTP